MGSRYRFNRLELAGSLGDLGTLLPLAIGLIVINGLHPTGLFLSVGAFYVFSGIYFGVTVPVQPMKVVGAYAIATAMSASQITGSGLLLGLVLLAIGITGAVTVIGKYTPKSVVRGVQLSTGTLLMGQGVKFIIGTSALQKMQQAAEPYLSVQSIGMIPIGLIVGTAGGLLTLLLIENRRFPAGLVVVVSGLLLGFLLGLQKEFQNLSVGIHLPQFLPFGWPTTADLTFAVFALVLPQIPMTLGNAIIAYADLSKDYFGENASRISYRGACISMALANFLSFLVGGMPICHGAGGLAAHYRFGARTAGSNLFIGVIFIGLALMLGEGTLVVFHLLPLSVLGILLLFAGAQLAMTIGDLKDRKDLFVCLTILGITLASNLAAGFIAGIIVAYLLKIKSLQV